MERGDQALAFSLKNQDGQTINLGDYFGKQSVVLFFYPKDHTPGCTKEACTFRDFHSEFESLNCKIFGISSDNVAKHKKFAEDFNLKYDLLADVKKEARKLYKVPTNLLGLVPGRVTYVIDPTGKIAHVFNSQTNPTDHISEALETIKKF